MKLRNSLKGLVTLWGKVMDQLMEKTSRFYLKTSREQSSKFSREFLKFSARYFPAATQATNLH